MAKTYVIKTDCFAGNAGELVSVRDGMDGDWCTNLTTNTVHCPFIDWDNVTPVSKIHEYDFTDDMASKPVEYMDKKPGIYKHDDDPEQIAEFGHGWTVISPLSPWAMGWDKHEEICDDETAFDGVYAHVDYEARHVTVYRE